MSEQDNQDRLENKSVSVRFKKKPGCIIKMDVLVTKEATQATFMKAMKEVRKEISIPGFRKGKVPEDVITKRFSDSLDKHFRSLLTEVSFQEGISLIKRPPFTRKSIRTIEIVSLDKDKGAEVYFEYEAFPEVPQVDPDKLNIQNIPVIPPTEEDVSNQLFKLLFLHAEKTPVDEEHSCCLGDFVTVTITSQKDTTTPVIEKKEFYLDPKFSREWLINAICGMKKKESKEIELPKETEDSATETCTFVIEDILSCVLPEDNDAFAQKAHAENRDDLLSKLRARLTFESQFKAFEQIRHDVRSELINLWAFDLPQSLIEGETEARIASYINMQKKQKSELPLERDSLKKEFLDEVKRYFTLLFLLKPLAQTIDLGGVQQSEVLEELTHQMMHSPFETRYIYPGLPEEEAHHRLLMALLMRKCEDWCIKKRLGISMPHRS